jgi:hypothetical protein
MFVAVGLVAMLLGWFAWERQIVRDRRAFIRELYAAGGEVHLAEQQICWGGLWGKYPHIPKCRLWMGDKAVTLVFVPADSTVLREQRNAPGVNERRAARLFPEASIHVLSTPSTAGAMAGPAADAATSRATADEATTSLRSALDADVTLRKE